MPQRTRPDDGSGSAHAGHAPPPRTRRSGSKRVGGKPRPDARELAGPQAHGRPTPGPGLRADSQTTGDPTEGAARQPSKSNVAYLLRHLLRLGLRLLFAPPGAPCPVSAQVTTRFRRSRTIDIPVAAALPKSLLPRSGL